MLVWIVVITLAVNTIICFLDRAYRRDGTMIIHSKKLNIFCSGQRSLAQIVAGISAVVLAFMLLLMVMGYAADIDLITERNAVQATLDTFRRNATMKGLKPNNYLYQQMGAINHVFEINKQISVRKYWNNSIWFGVFIYDGVADLKYVE